MENAVKNFLGGSLNPKNTYKSHAAQTEVNNNEII